jgi:hypothetical protein
MKAEASGCPVTTLEVPAEVDLSAGDPITVEGEYLRVPASTSVSPGHLVGHDHLVAALDESYEFKLLPLAGPRPTSLEYPARSSSTSIGLENVNLSARIPLTTSRSPAAKAR